MTDNEIGIKIAHLKYYDNVTILTKYDDVLFNNSYINLKNDDYAKDENFISILNNTFMKLKENDAILINRRSNNNLEEINADDEILLSILEVLKNNNKNEFFAYMITSNKFESSIAYLTIFVKVPMPIGNMKFDKSKIIYSP